MLLETIEKENDIKKIPLEQMPVLAQEIRDFLLESLSKTGGHLASNLGAVELTMALHYVFSLPKDKIIWDVGHQSYTHKILTGRKDGFKNLRQYGGLSGFPKREESPCDAYDTGHQFNFHLSRSRLCLCKQSKWRRVSCGIGNRRWCADRRNGL